VDPALAGLFELGAPLGLFLSAPLGFFHPIGHTAPYAPEQTAAMMSGLKGLSLQSRWRSLSNEL
jgi:hypothetical protein